MRWDGMGWCRMRYHALSRDMLLFRCAACACDMSCPGMLSVFLAEGHVKLQASQIHMLQQWRQKHAFTQQQHAKVRRDDVLVICCCVVHGMCRVMCAPPPHNAMFTLRYVRCDVGMLCVDDAMCCVM